MIISIEDQVIDYYNDLFEKIFSDPFRSKIELRTKRNSVIRQVQEAADAASQSLIRFFMNEQLDEKQVTLLLNSYSNLNDLVELEQVSNPNMLPENLTDQVIKGLLCPAQIQHEQHEAIFRIALLSIIQVLMLVGPVMVEWQKLNFSSTFELPRRVVNRLNQITGQMDAIGRSGQAAADERFELTYRDYILQRFHRVEAGTVRMTTNLDVDLRELFVMPQVRKRILPLKGKSSDKSNQELMNLETARKLYSNSHSSLKYLIKADDESTEEKKNRITALEFIKHSSRIVIVGPPGIGKSTFLEWLQVKVASVEEELILSDQQAIPLLLRVRQLDPKNLPYDAALIEKATLSRDRATLMPPDWIDRQMNAGRILFMLDGLDEVEPDHRDNLLIPWLADLIRKYPRCKYVISSRPVGYPLGKFRKLKFTESDLLDFEDFQIIEYTHHWCVAVRLARNEPEEEARREGEKDGTQIVEGFKDHPFIRNLARNPLMLSAICLVDYFESGQLPKDRALLYKLCVEGLIHNWDKRRGINSEFSLEEKLRACREVALDMQANDRAEYEADKVKEIFRLSMGDEKRANKLFEHIRYRTGLLLERRQGIFAFAHLTFQEYLAAQAIYEGNNKNVDVNQLVREHDDGRWQEVIPLYCGLAPSTAVRCMIENLLIQSDTHSLAYILSEAFISSGHVLARDKELRRLVIRRVARAPGGGHFDNPLFRFSIDEVAPIANESLGTIESDSYISTSHGWLIENNELIDYENLISKLNAWSEYSPNQLAEVVHLLCSCGSDNAFEKMAMIPGLLSSPGPNFKNGERYSTQAEIVIIGFYSLARRWKEKAKDLPGFESLLEGAFTVIVSQKEMSRVVMFNLVELVEILSNSRWFPKDKKRRLRLAVLARRLVEKKIDGIKTSDVEPLKDIKHLDNYLLSWARSLEKGVRSRSSSQ